MYNLALAYVCVLWMLRMYSQVKMKPFFALTPRKLQIRVNFR